METNQQLTVKKYFEVPDVRKRLEEMLGTKAQGFITSVLQIVSNSKLLSTASPMSVYHAAAMAATLDLPINQNLGFAWIIPYAGEAQFQMGYKGFVQLAQRTAQYKKINALEVYENQFESWDALTEELKADFTKEGEGKVVGYIAFFKTINGFEKSVFWTTAKVLKHAKKYSKNFSKGLWQTDFDEMAKKTVLKTALSKWGILSIEMQKAITIDQAVIDDPEGNTVRYPDNEEEKVSAEVKRITELINQATSLSELNEYLGPAMEYKIAEVWEAKNAELKNK